MTQVRIATCSETGARAGNEDALAHGRARNGWFAVLADGAGGHRRGAEAARRVVECAVRLLADDAVAFSPSNLTRIVQLAHFELLHHQDSELPDARMHATLVVLWLDAVLERALWTHVGDSRLYRIRHGRNDVVTADDSVVQRMQQAGVISAEQARQHPQKNQLLAALGMQGEIEPHTVARPVELLEGDAFLLCSDGWWEEVDPSELTASLGRALTPDDWVADMRSRIIGRAKPKQDNFSAVALWVGNPGEVTRPDADDTVPGGRPAD